MSPRPRETFVATGMYLRHKGFRKVKVNGLTPEDGPSRALHCRLPIEELKKGSIIFKST